jgi:hypothetical protein
MKNDYSNFKLEELKEQYLVSVLIPQLKAVSNVMLQNDSTFLVSNKVHQEMTRRLTTLDNIRRYQTIFSTRCPSERDSTCPTKLPVVSGIPQIDWYKIEWLR